MSTKTPEKAWQQSKYAAYTNDDYSINTVKAAFLAGYEAGLKADKWISSEEQLPQNGQYVLVPSRTGVAPAYFELGHEQLWTIWDCPGCINAEKIVHFITHWQPLPEPPKEEK